MKEEEEVRIGCQWKESYKYKPSTDVVQTVCMWGRA